ncbi:MAG: helix-turn-helix domain-containing protein [Bacilli bacterium]
MEEMEQQPITIQEYRKKLNKLTCKIPELAEILDISVDKARRLTHIEGFPCVRVGRDIRIILSKLDEWLSENIGKVL